MIYNSLFFVYKTFFSWTLKIFFGGGCRYIPTCSDYSKEALEIHGLWKGTVLSVKRLFRCHPWSNFGFDPVPSKDKTN